MTVDVRATRHVRVRRDVQRDLDVVELEIEGSSGAVSSSANASAPDERSAVVGRRQSFGRQEVEVRSDRGRRAADLSDQFVDLDVG